MACGFGEAEDMAAGVHYSCSGGQEVELGHPQLGLRRGPHWALEMVIGTAQKMKTQMSQQIQWLLLLLPIPPD